MVVQVTGISTPHFRQPQPQPRPRLVAVGETVLGVRGHPQPRPISPVRDQAARPVVLVHGFAASRTGWFALRRALRADGRTVVSFDYPSWASSVDELADRLVDTVEDLLAVTGADKVRLVGHSLGRRRPAPVSGGVDRDDTGQGLRGSVMRIQPRRIPTDLLAHRTEAFPWFRAIRSSKARSLR
jgi:pimeloyl-ACP methyl ester carboxylesterase